MPYKFFFPVLILLFTLVPQAGAGTTGPIGVTDGGADRLVYYFDTRGRQSYVQLANLSNSVVGVHVQIWTANSSIVDCEEYDYFDIYTQGDVHTYDMSDILKNDGAPLSPEFGPPSGSYGFVVISRFSGPSDSLVGTMRIIDAAEGYEYRSNALAPESVSSDTNSFSNINFNNINGNAFSELIGFTYSEISSATVYASPGVKSVFGDISDAILIVDEHENLTSCSPATLACSDGSTNIAIDISLPNSKGNPNKVCNTSIIGPGNDSGHLIMPFSSFVCDDINVGDAGDNCLFDTHFAGFIGLNNGDGSGSFDSWWEGGTP